VTPEALKLFQLDDHPNQFNDEAEHPVISEMM
jgi:hypothetical protein